MRDLLIRTMPGQDATAAVTPARTAWSRNLATPLREFMRTEAGGAAILVSATVLALVWVNVDAGSYESVWRTHVALRVGGFGVNLSLRQVVNDGLMTLFFFVVGLEARREFDMGELRQRRRIALPLLAGIGGMAMPVAIYLAINAGHASSHGWGAAMSTDTAIALGLLALLGPRIPGRLRSFMLTVVVIDDIVALVVISTVYASHTTVVPLVWAAALLACILIVRAARIRNGLVFGGLATALWVALLKSGTDPVVTGLVIGLLISAYPPSRPDLERASSLFRRFREQPTPELARSARAGLESALSPNERLQHLYHPWTSYVIVPVFALANAGIVIDRSSLANGLASRITLGIAIGYVVGKPVGVLGASWLITRLSGGRVRPPVGWATVAAGGAVAGVGFTVALLVATLAFSGAGLEQAKLGVLCAAVLASTLTWLVFRATSMLPSQLRIRAVLGTAETIVDLQAPVDEDRDHVRGPSNAPVTLIEYGDFQCPYCGRAESVIRELLADFGELEYIWRHLPLTDVHPSAQIAAEAAEAASAQGAFWEMHALLLRHQDALRPPDLRRYAEQLGLEVDRFSDELRTHVYAGRIAEDVDSADLSGVAGTPTFFINGRRHHGAYDIATLAAAVRTARARAVLAR
jgi:Na+/H+ antiporter NhaA